MQPMLYLSSRNHFAPVKYVQRISLLPARFQDGVPGRSPMLSRGACSSTFHRCVLRSANRLHHYSSSGKQKVPVFPGCHRCIHQIRSWLLAWLCTNENALAFLLHRNLACKLLHRHHGIAHPWTRTNVDGLTVRSTYRCRKVPYWFQRVESNHLPGD